MSLELQLSGSTSIEWQYVDERGRPLPSVDAQTRRPSQPQQRRNFTSPSVQKWLKAKGASVSDVQVEGRVLSQAARRSGSNDYSTGALPQITSPNRLHGRVASSKILMTANRSDVNAAANIAAGTSSTAALPAFDTAEPISREEAELENGLSLQSIKASMPPEMYERLGYGLKAAADLKAQRRRAAQEKVWAKRCDFFELGLASCLLLPPRPTPQVCSLNHKPSEVKIEIY